jgi:flagellar hook-basal body complex protein FliE
MSIAPIGALGGLELKTIEATPHATPSTEVAGTESTQGASGGGGGFAGALTKAVNSLEAAQTSASEAAKAVALGTTTDPESAIVAIQNAKLEMEMASQVRTKATEALTNLFETQV